MLYTHELDYTLEDEMELAETERSYNAFFRKTHTHNYTLAGESQASSRLDR